jgi:putative transposase
VSGRGDALVRPGGPVAAEVSQWRRFLAAEEDEEILAIIRRHGRTGRPWGDPRFLVRLEKQLSRRLAPRRPGRPRKGP